MVIRCACVIVVTVYLALIRAVPSRSRGPPPWGCGSGGGGGQAGDGGKSDEGGDHHHRLGGGSGGGGGGGVSGAGVAEGATLVQQPRQLAAALAEATEGGGTVREDVQREAAWVLTGSPVYPADLLSRRFRGGEFHQA